jgi:hypothetical protein
MNPYAVTLAVATLLYNNSPQELAELLWPGRHPSYIDEWANRFGQGLGCAAGRMDSVTFCRFVDLAIERHGEYAQMYHPDDVEGAA